MSAGRGKFLTVLSVLGPIHRNLKRPEVRFLLITATVIAAVAWGLVSWFGPTVQTLTSVMLITAALLPTIVRHSPTLFLALTKATFWLRNTSATWDLEVRFSELRAPPDPRRLAERVVRWGGRDAAIISAGDSRAVARVLRRFVVEFHSSAVGMPGMEEAPQALNVSISPVTVGYRDSRAFLSHELLPLLEQVRGEVGAGSASYGLRVDLPESNPYYGLYLRELRAAEVRDFSVTIEIPQPSDGSRVTIEKERLTVVAGTVEGFRTATIAALAYRLPVSGRA